jgi:hypothetical protein
MRRSRIAAALLLILAVALVAGLVQFRTQAIITHGDYSVTRSFEGEPVLTTYGDVVDLACFGPHPCGNMASARRGGLFPREGVPQPIAFWGGVIAPVLLVCFAFFLFVQPLRGRQQIVRAIGAVVLFLCGTALTTPVVWPVGLALGQHTFSHSFPRGEIPILLLFCLPGLLFLAAGTWLTSAILRPGVRPP